MKKVLLSITFLLCALDSFCEKNLDDCLGNLDNIVCVDLYIQNPELFLKHKFFDAVEKESTLEHCILLKSIARITNCIPAVYILIWGGSTLFDRLQIHFGAADEVSMGVSDVEKAFKYVIAFFCSLGISLSVSFFVYKGLNKFTDWAIPEKDYKKGCYLILKEFLDNWETYKICTPKMFHAFFDRLYNCYIQGGSSENLTDLGEIGCVISNRNLKNAAYDIVKHIQLVLDGKVTFSSDSTEWVESIQIA